MRISSANPPNHTGVLVLSNGLIFKGYGVGATGEAVGEVCFNTAMTGYQEILTDPSYAGQFVTFTFPHIGNVGVNNEDVEFAADSAVQAARGVIFREKVTSPSNYRSQFDLPGWLKRRGVIGLCGIDTRALSAMIREQGMPHGVIAHSPSGNFDIEAMQVRAKEWAGLEGRDLAKDMTALSGFSHSEALWTRESGFENKNADAQRPLIVVIDYGVKKNILRLLADQNCRVQVVPASTSFEEIISFKPDGVVLSNGPGDPVATGDYAVPIIRKLIDCEIPVFGICLGHQMLALALGAKTQKMDQGHHGANHPVKDLTTGKVEIVSMNHGFCVDAKSLPENVSETHTSLFDGTNCGIALKGKKVFSVQHHPEASPGPQDSFYIFKRFVDSLGDQANAA